MVARWWTGLALSCHPCVGSSWAMLLGMPSSVPRALHTIGFPLLLAGSRASPSPQTAVLWKPLPARPFPKKHKWYRESKTGLLSQAAVPVPRVLLCLSGSRTWLVSWFPEFASCPSSSLPLGTSWVRDGMSMGYLAAPKDCHLPGAGHLLLKGSPCTATAIVASGL